MDPSYWLIAAGIPTFLALQFIAAPYGKFAPSNSSTSQSKSQSTSQSSKTSIWGPPINSRLAWFLQETPSIIMSIYAFSTSPKAQYFASGNRFLLALFLYHYLFRAWIGPLFMSNPSKNTSMPLVVCMLSFTFCVCNGWLQGYAIGHLIDAFAISDMSITQWIGVVIFFIGWATNQYSDHILRNLRKSNDRSYHIPYGGLFQYVTSANYFGEFVEWFGFALINRSLASWAFVLYTAANLFPRAAHTHEWYQKKFPDYPKDRKIVIPFVW